MIAFRSAALGLAALMWASVANAAVVTFSDLENEVIPTAYQGLTWNNWAVDTAAADGSGFEYGLRYGPSVAYNRFGTEATVSTSGQTFNYQGGWFNAAWKDGLQLTIKAYDEFSSLVHTQTLSLDVQNPIYFSADWNHIAFLSFSAEGGTPRPDLFNIDTNHFVMASFEWDQSISPAPEPGTWTMMIVGFGLSGAGLRATRRRALSPA